jgi:hypothetical protein
MNNIKENYTLNNLTPYTFTEENLEIGIWILIININIIIPENIIWKNTNLQIMLENQIVPNGNIDFSTFNTQKNSFTNTLSYTYNMIFENINLSSLCINITGSFDNIDNNSNPLLLQSTNYFLTKK